MKRWKKCLAVGLSMATMATTVACGNGNTAASEEPSEQPQEQAAAEPQEQTTDGEKPKIVFWDMVWCCSSF